MSSKRLKNYLEAIENNTVAEYHDKHGRYYGLRRCPVCNKAKKLYIIKRENQEIIFARCFYCGFFYNPEDIKTVRSSSRRFKREDVLRGRYAKPKYILSTQI